MYKQKVKHLLYEHQHGLAALKLDGEAAVKQAGDEAAAHAADLRCDQRVLQRQLREQARRPRAGATACSCLRACCKRPWQFPSLCVAYSCLWQDTGHMNESVAFLERQDTKQGCAILPAGPCSGMFFLEGSRGTAPVHMHARSEHNSMSLNHGTSVWSCKVHRDSLPWLCIGGCAWRGGPCAPAGRGEAGEQAAAGDGGQRTRPGWSLRCPCDICFSRQLTESLFAHTELAYRHSQAFPPVALLNCYSFQTAHGMLWW